MSRLFQIALGALFLSTGCSGRACTSESQAREREVGPAASAVASNTPTLIVPHATVPITIDGELDEPNWRKPARTGAFRDATRAIGRPYSDARLLWDDDSLYLVLYAADENIETKVTEHDGPVWIDDAFTLRFAPQDSRQPSFAIDISAAGVITDARQSDKAELSPNWESGIRVALDRDGTPNDPRDDDEEWLVEAAIPFEPLGIAAALGTRFALTLSRCDTPRGSKRVCGSWNGSVELGR